MIFLTWKVFFGFLIIFHPYRSRMTGKGKVASGRNVRVGTIKSRNVS